MSNLVRLFLDCAKVSRTLKDSKFGTHGSRVIMDKEDPTFTYNLMMGKICLTLWQFVDLLNLIGVPKDPLKPLQRGNWFLTDFVQNKVSSSSTGLSVFPYCRSFKPIF